MPLAMTDLDELRKQLTASLPEQTKWRLRETWVSFNFSRLKHSLLPVTSERTLGAIPEEWSRYRVFGEEYFENGGAFVCVDEVDGSIQRIDVELDDPVSLFSTSANQFVASFCLLENYFASQTQSPEDLVRQLRLTDAAAFDTGCQWRLLSDYLR